jgi:hypothetical protein
MTTSTVRTLAEVLKSRAFVAKSIEGMEATLSEVRGLRVTNTIYVLGWPSYGLFLKSKNTVGGLMFARQFDNAHTPSRMTVTNGSGERAIVVTLGRAREMVIEQMEGVVTQLEGMLQDADMEADDAAYRETTEALAAEKAAELEGLREDIASAEAHIDRLEAKLAKAERELARHRKAVEVALDYFDDHADADCDEDGYVPNCELRASSEMRAWLDGSMGQGRCEPGGERGWTFAEAARAIARSDDEYKG